MILVNFKGYEQAMGEKALKIARKCREVSENTGKPIHPIPQTQDIQTVSNTGLKTYAQHISSKEPGSHTGHTIAEGVKRIGTAGTLINHSERRIQPKKIKKTARKAKEKNLETIICVKNVEEAERYSDLNPDYISIEPPELIGGNKAVSTEKPGLLEDTVNKTPENIEVLAGAGIKTKEDVEKAVKLGCTGILIASGIIKSDKPKQKLKELTQGL